MCYLFISTASTLALHQDLTGDELIALPRYGWLHVLPQLQWQRADQHPCMLAKQTCPPHLAARVLVDSMLRCDVLQTCSQHALLLALAVLCCRMLLFEEQAAQSPLPADIATPGVYGGLTAEPSPSPSPAPELTMDKAEAAAAAAAADAAEASGEPSSPALELDISDPRNEPPQSEPAADQAEVSSAPQQPSDEQASAVDQAAAPVDPVQERAAPVEQPATDSSSGSSDVIPVVDEGAVQVDDSTEAADGRGRAAELVQRSSNLAGLADGTAGSAAGAPAQGSGGWSGAQAAGLAMGLIAAAGVAGVAVMKNKRRQVPQQQRYTYGSEVEMRGLI